MPIVLTSQDAEEVSPRAPDRMYTGSSAVSPDPSRGRLTAQLRAAGCVFAEEEAALLHAEAANAEQLRRMVSERVAGRPLEHILGWAEFCGRRIFLQDGVFVPRQRTQFLVRLAVARAQPGSVVVDLCCGSAAIAAAIAAAIDPAEVHAVDIDAAAVRCARRNIADGHVYRGDLFAPLPHRLRGRVDVLSANVPYVPSREIALLPSESREHEPRASVDGGDDGLDTLRRVTAQVTDWLAPGGQLYLETSAEQAGAAAEAVAAGGLRPQIHHSAELDATAVVGVMSRVDQAICAAPRASE
jgi:release factor glutamine methyltransferase